MKRFLYTLIYFSFLIGLNRCGIKGVAEQTHEQVVASNEKQAELLESMKRTEELTTKLKKLNEEIASGIHLQILSVSLEGLFKEENTKSLNPPLKMMPFAKTYAEEATAEELAQTAHVLLQEVYFAPTGMRSKLVSLVAMSAIAAFTPEEKTQELLKQQIEKQGVYEESAYAFATCRNDFIEHFLYVPLLENSKFHNLATLEEGVRYFKSLKNLAELPYVNELKLNITSISPTIDLAVDPNKLLSLAKKGRRLFERKLRPNILKDPRAVLLLESFEL